MCPGCVKEESENEQPERSEGSRRGQGAESQDGERAGQESLLVGLGLLSRRGCRHKGWSVALIIGAIPME